jgi:multidrug efflux pump subunit AcrA (membrane-fusion protein)
MMINLRIELVGTLAAILLLVCGCRGEKEDDVDTRVPVQVVPAVQRDFQEKLTFPGVTTTHLVSDVGFQVGGEVTALTLEVGDTVTPGTILGQLDASSYQDSAAASQAQVGVAASQLEEVKAGSRPQEISKGAQAVDQAQASVDQAKASRAQAKASLDLARIERDRYKAVLDAEAIPLQKFQQVEAEHEMAREAFDASGHQVRQAEKVLGQAKADYSLVLEGPRREQIETAKANLQSAQAKNRQAQNQVLYTTLRAPFSGVVSRKHVEVGMVVSPGSPVYEIRSSGALEFETQVPSVHIERIVEEMPATISLKPAVQQVLEGRVVEIQPVNDEKLRNFRVKLRLAERPFAKNLSGVIGEATFTFGESLPGLEVPVSAVLQREGGYAVMLLDDQDKVEQVPVELLLVRDERCRIAGPIPDGKRVIVSGQEYVQPGREVRVVEALGAGEIVTPDRDDPNTGSKK